MPAASLQSAQPFDKRFRGVLVIYDGYPVSLVIEIQKAETLHRPWLASRSFEFYETGYTAREDDKPVRHSR